jgi:hypothetical protein
MHVGKSSLSIVFIPPFVGAEREDFGRKDYCKKKILFCQEDFKVLELENY